LFYARPHHAGAHQAYLGESDLAVSIDHHQSRQATHPEARGGLSADLARDVEPDHGRLAVQTVL
jgi:hypothetical protein